MPTTPVTVDISASPAALSTFVSEHGTRLEYCTDVSVQ